MEFDFETQTTSSSMKKVPNVEHILLDIDGTLLPLTFTKDTLFPYALSCLSKILSTRWSSPAFQAYITPFSPSIRASSATFLTHYSLLTHSNSKDPAFKALQGYLFASGYESGDLTTPFFADVAPALRQWQNAGVGISVYSAGSVEAQQLLFQYADGGDKTETKVTDDLRGLVSAWFDTTTAGPKTESESYKKILEEIGVKTEHVVFFSDALVELERAREVGIRGVLLERPGNSPVAQTREVRAGFEGIRSFDELAIEGVKKRSGKKRKVDDDDARSEAKEAGQAIQVSLENNRQSEKQAEPDSSQKRRRSQRLKDIGRRVE